MTDQQQFQAYGEFLLETLHLVSDSDGDPQKVHLVWEQQQARFNTELLAVMCPVIIEFLERNVEQQISIASVLINFGNLIQQFQLGTRWLNLELGISAYKLALQVYSHAALREDWAMTQHNLAKSYSERILGDRAENLELSIASYKCALTVYTCRAFTNECCKTARSLGNLYFDQKLWLEAATAYTLAFWSSEILYQSCLLLTDKASELSENAALSHRTAYALARAGKYKRAVKTLERSRAHALSETLDKRLQPIRQIPGNKEFPTALTFEDISRAVQCNQPLVYLLHTSIGSLALIITINRVDSIWLNNWNDEKQVEVLITWFNDQRDEQPNKVWHDTIDSITNQLWEPLIQPIVQHLKANNIHQATFIPTGLLSFIPLHAAWTIDATCPTGRHYALDDIHFTYAPNVKSLITAKAIADRIPADSILAIDNPRNDPKLANSEKEINAAIESFPDRTVLRHAEATVEKVRSRLSEAAIVHFSCHGKAYVSETKIIDPETKEVLQILTPLDSCLQMSDGNLTLKDIFALKLTEKGGIRLAILSACETGLQGIENADEAISLPTGLLQAGVAGAIASLWSVSDLSTMILLTRFYDFWRKENLEPSLALRRAQLWVRDTTSQEKAKYFKPDRPDLFQVLILLPPNEFAHPFHWSAFSYTGI